MLRLISSFGRSLLGDRPTKRNVPSAYADHGHPAQLPSVAIAGFLGTPSAGLSSTPSRSSNNRQMDDTVICPPPFSQVQKHPSPRDTDNCFTFSPSTFSEFPMTGLPTPSHRLPRYDTTFGDSVNLKLMPDIPSDIANHGATDDTLSSSSNNKLVNGPSSIDASNRSSTMQPVILTTLSSMDRSTIVNSQLAATRSPSDPLRIASDNFDPHRDRSRDLLYDMEVVEDTIGFESRRKVLARRPLQSWSRMVLFCG